MWHSDTAALKFEDVPVADEAVLSPLGSGAKVARRVLLRGRVGIGALALGLARDSLERAAVYAQQRKVAGGSLIDQPLTRAKLSRMEGDLWVAWQAIRSAAQLADQSKPFKVQACMAKVFATEAALRITDEAVQILGGYGYMGDYKVEQNYRDARLLTIGEGASEILRLAIARNLLEKDAEGVLASVDTLPDAAVPSDGSMSALWGPCGRTVQLAAECLHIVREQFQPEGLQADSGSAWQCEAAGFADLATKLWVVTQVIPRTGTGLLNRGSGSQRQMELAKKFVAASSVDICHQASEFLRKLGLTDSKLYNNYVEALQIGATIYGP
jgi:hypothetical protein